MTTAATDAKTTTKALVHRLRQARTVLLRAQLAMTGAQILFWVVLAGVVVGLALRVWRRRSGRSVRDAALDSEAPQDFSSPAVNQ